jgi:hypothetical protein
MSWTTALSGRAETVDSSEETVVNGAPYRPRTFQQRAGRAETVDPSEQTVINGAPYRPRPFPNNAATHEAANKRLDTRLAEDLRRRALAVMRAR